MRPNYLYVALFVAVVMATALAVFPRGTDLATLYSNSGMYEQALGLLARLATEQPGDPALSVQRAKAMYGAGDYDQAADLLRDLVRQQPGDVAAWRLLADLYEEMQLPHEAMGAFEQVLAAAPTDSLAMVKLEDYYRWFQLNDKEIVNLQALIARFPQQITFRDDLVDLYTRMNLSDETVTALRSALAVFPDSTRLRQQLAQVYLTRRDPQALPLFTQLQQAAPDRPDLMDGLLNAMVLAGRSENEVTVRFDTFYRSRVEPTVYYDKLSRLLLQLGDAGGAIKALEARLALSPDPDTGTQLAQLYARNGALERAALQMADVVRQHPDRPDLWAVYIPFLSAARKKNELVRALEEYTRRWPDDQDARRQLVDAYEWVADYASALEVVEQLLAAQPANVELHRLAARIAMAAGQPGVAVAHLTKAGRGIPADAEARDEFLHALMLLPADAQTVEWAQQLYAAVGPEPADAALLLASLQFRSGHRAEADHIRQAVAVAHPGNAAVRARLGDDCRQNHDANGARHWYAEALAADSSNETALAGMAELVTDPAATARYLDRLARLHAGDIDILYRAALAKEAAGDSAGAAGGYAQVLRLAAGSTRSDADFLRCLAHAHLRTGGAVQARELLQQAVIRYPDNAAAATDYAEVLVAAGDDTAALLVLRAIPRP